jgi:hypothetical protein
MTSNVFFAFYCPFYLCQILDVIPKTESLKQVVERSRVYWDEVITPALQSGRTLLIVGHENNLRSILMRLEDISPNDIINLDLPRAVPLAYRLDANLKPIDRPDGKLDEATGFLHGDWLCGDKAVSEILKRDHMQVYDTSIAQNLETDCGIEHQTAKVKNWMGMVFSTPTPPPPNGEGCGRSFSDDDRLEDFVGGVPVRGVEQDAYRISDTRRDKHINGGI